MLRITVFILFLATAFNLKAQFSVGARVGYGAYGAYFEPPDLNNRQESFYKPNTGLVIVYNNMNNAGLQTEINLMQKGWMEQDTSYWKLVQHPDKPDQDTITKPDSYFKRQINYIEIPFYSRWEIGSGKFRPVIIAGPYVAWKLSDKVESLNYEWWWHDENQYLTYEQEIRDLDFGIKLGLGLKYDLNKSFSVFVDLRYDLQMAGGQNIFKDHPNKIQASRLKETSGSFGILWHIIHQKQKKEKKGYVPKENLFETF